MRLIEILLTAGICLMIPVPFLPTTVQQYVFFIPCLMILLMFEFMIREGKIHRTQMILFFSIVLVFFLTGFKFGVTADHIVSVTGILLIPIVTQLYMTRKPEYFMRVLVLTFTLLEISLIIFIVLKGSFFNHEFNIYVREVFLYTYPNYLAMFSAVKIGLVIYLYNNGLFSSKSKNIMSLISLLVIATSLSRTAFIMAGVIYILPLFFKDVNNKTKLRRLKSILLIISVIPILIFALQSKESRSEYTTVDYTMSERYVIWSSMTRVLDDNFIFGIGFRGVTDYVDNITASHNDFLDILLKGGLFMFLVIYFYILRRLYILFKRREITLLSVGISILAGGVTQNPLKFLPTLVVMAIVLSKSYGGKFENKQQEVAREKVSVNNEYIHYTDNAF